MPPAPLLSLLLALGACDRPPADPADRAAAADPVAGAPEAPRPPRELGQRVDDVAHWVGKAASLRAAGDATAAERVWSTAYDVFRAELVGHLRAVDPARALELEYAFGRFRLALRRSDAQASRWQRAVLDQLDAARPLVVDHAAAVAADPG